MLASRQRFGIGRDSAAVKAEVLAQCHVSYGVTIRRPRGGNRKAPPVPSSSPPANAAVVRPRHEQRRLDSVGPHWLGTGPRGRPCLVSHVRRSGSRCAARAKAPRSVLGCNDHPFRRRLIRSRGSAAPNGLSVGGFAETREFCRGALQQSRLGTRRNPQAPVSMAEVS